MLEMERGGIAELIETGQFEEGLNLEAKLGSRGVPRNAWETISAFANTDGGLLILGLEEVNDGWHAVGVPEAAKVVQDIANQFRDRGKISVSVSGPNDIWIETAGDAALIVVRVPRAPRRHRPVFLNRDPDRAYLRNGEGDSLCSDEELLRMRRDADSIRGDMRVLPLFGMDDFDFDAIERYRALSQEKKPSLACHRLDRDAFLRSVGAWHFDRELAVEGPTVAGILMFGKEQSIREIRSNHVIDYRRLSSSDVTSLRYRDRVRWRGNLFGAWEQIYPRLIRGLPTSFRLRGPYRVDEPDGLESLREAFVNLLVHTDYEDSRDAIVLHRDDGYLFGNPGDSWVDLQDIGVQTRSERRNPTIAQLFDDLALADQAGSGFVRIFDEWREMGFRRPAVVSDAAQYEFRLELNLAGLLPHAERQWLSGIGGPWREEEELALVFAHRHGYVDNQMLRTSSGQHLFDASQTLRSLRDRGLLELRGAGKNVLYILGKDVIDSGAGIYQNRLDLEAAGRPSSGHMDESSGHLPGSSGHMDESSGHLPGGDHAPLRVDAEETDDWQRLRSIAEPVSLSGKASTSAVDGVVLALCAERPLSTSDLVRLLNRDTRTVRRYLIRLLAEHRLAPIHAQRTHPDQRYMTIVR